MAGRRQWRRAIAACAIAVLLGGCSEDLGDLRAFVARVKERPGAPIPPLPEFEPYRSFTYDPTGLRNPFQPRSVFATTDETHKGTGSGLSPDLDRPRQPLEQYPLDSLTMVGTLSRNGVRRGLVQDPTGTIHRVLPGNYMGQNFGRVVAVTPDAIRLIEIIPNGRGGWMKRRATLPLTDGNSDKKSE